MTEITGMNPDTGARAEGLAALRDSVRNILTTPIGSLVMHREYGSLLPRLIDQPLNDATLLRAYSATVIAITRWEPRLRVRAVRKEVHAGQPGAATLSLDAVTADGEAVDINTPVTGGVA